MQLAETLAIPFQDVYVKVVDSDSVGFNDTSGGSRTTFATGLAAYELGKKLQQQMAEAAASFWEVNAGAVTVEGAVYTCAGERLTFREIARIVGEGGVPVMASASVHPQKPGGAAAVHIVDVEVDPETGKVTILRYTALQDVGKAVHPAYVEGQIQGGTAQGIGWALNEEYWYDEQGHLANASLLDYRMPTAVDLPMIDTQLVEVANPAHPFGVRGVGEAPIIPPAAALANAIYHATGVRMAELPMSPDRLVKAMTAQPVRA
jgi:CO/xanthine dehydrogenase Mo-binding subunit